MRINEGGRASHPSPSSFKPLLDKVMAFLFVAMIFPITLTLTLFVEIWSRGEYGRR